MPKFSQSKYFPMVVSQGEFPLLFEFLTRGKERGRAKRFICRAAEDRLKDGEKKADESIAFERLEEQLDEIRKLILSGNFAVKTDTPEENVKQSPKVSGLLSALGL